MASSIILTDPPSEIGYRASTGEIYFVDIKGEVFLDKYDGIHVDGWEVKVREFVSLVGLDVPRPGIAPNTIHVPAFIEWLKTE